MRPERKVVIVRAGLGLDRLGTGPQFLPTGKASTPGPVRLPAGPGAGH